MEIRWLTAFLDFPPDQFGSEVTFWRAITGSTVSPPRGPHREFASLEPFNGDPHIAVQRIADGPGGIHLDLHVTDVDAATAEAVGLGARVVNSFPDPGYHVLTSPGGFVFCVVPWHGPYRRARPIRWPGDTISTVDRLGLDSPPQAFEAETEFWRRLSGWPLAPSGDDATRLFRRDPDLALTLLVRRNPSLAADDPAVAYLDVAATAVDDEVTRHEDWGASVVDRGEHWAEMADPVGRRYRITDRNPRTGI